MSEPRLLPAYITPPASQHPSRAALVPAIREAVHQWRRNGYQGVTQTTRDLLTHWFETDHQIEASGETWLYYYCQREALETTIYLFEVLKKRDIYDLAREFRSQTPMSIDSYDGSWTRYAYKMATGSGKTKVMSLIIAWSYFNATREQPTIANDYAKTFLILAPNVIVYERLKQDFGDDGKIFRDDPVIPPEWSDEWQLEVITRDESSDRVTRDGALFLTNVQQLYDRRSSAGRNEPQQLRDVIGEPVVDSDISAGRQIRQALETRQDLMVLNDEGHHVHNKTLRWFELIDTLDQSFRNRTGKGIRAQLDFSATPKHNDGRLFNHIIVDYSIAQAIRDGVVKHPHLVTLEGGTEYQSDDAEVRYRDKLIAGIDRWKELRQRMKGTQREPLLFVMTENIKSADQVADWLSTQGGFKQNEVLTIHTNARGEITETASASRQRDIAMLRQASREVDSENSPYRVIVSVLMLREGWDVRNVCVIIPLRPYSAASQILPEQTLGRGLRRMFPLNAGDDREELLVIEHDAFRSFWENEIDEEDIPIDFTPNEDFLQTAITVIADPQKAPELEIEIPRLSPRLILTAPDLNLIDIHKLPHLYIEMPLDGIAETPIAYATHDMDTWEVVDRGEIQRDFPMTEAGYLNYISRLILRECRLSNLSNGFARLAPKIKTYIQDIMFKGKRSLAEKEVLHRLNDPSIKIRIFSSFVEAIRDLSIQPNSSVRDEADPILVSRTRPYVTRRSVVSNPRKSLFNYIPADSDFELRFARWLDRDAQDVAAFAKNEPAIGFSVTYRSITGGIRSYIPDFIVRTTHGDMYVIETKGLVTEEVTLKDSRITQWCRDATAHTKTPWRYIKVPQHTFENHIFHSIQDLQTPT